MAPLIPKGFSGTGPSWNAGVRAGGARSHLAEYVRSQGRPGKILHQFHVLFFILPLNFGEISAGGAEGGADTNSTERAGMDTPGPGLSRRDLTRGVGMGTPGPGLPRWDFLGTSHHQIQGRSRAPGLGKEPWRSWAMEQRPGHTTAPVPSGLEFQGHKSQRAPESPPRESSGDFLQHRQGLGGLDPSQGTDPQNPPGWIPKTHRDGSLNPAGWIHP